MTDSDAPRTIAWVGDILGHVRLIDQTLLPTQLVYRDCRTVEEVWEAIRMLRVRAPRLSAWRQPWVSSSACRPGLGRRATARLAGYVR